MTARKKLTPDELIVENVRRANVRYTAAKVEMNGATQELQTALRAFDEHVGIVVPEPETAHGD